MSEFHVDRELVVRASRATVWRFFDEPELFARWWGEGSTIEARVGAPVCIRYPNGDSVSGEVKSVVEGEEIVFSYGYDQPGKPIPPGGSLVRIQLSDESEGTRIRLRHSVQDAATRDLHVPGWRYQLAVFAKVLCDEQHADVASVVSDWFAAWNADDATTRAELLARCSTDGVEFADAYGNVVGQEELAQHIANVRRFMPLTLVEATQPRQALGSALVDWEMRNADGDCVARGSNVMRLDASGRIAETVSIPAP